MRIDNPIVRPINTGHNPEGLRLRSPYLLTAYEARTTLWRLQVGGIKEFFSYYY
jgi:hypothetical protein